MIEPGTIIVVVILSTIALIVMLIFKPELALTSTGKILAFLSLFMFPVLAGVLGTASHMENSKTTEFCLSCHEMTPFERGLLIDDSSFIPASYFQNIRVIITFLFQEARDG